MDRRAKIPRRYYSGSNDGKRQDAGIYQDKELAGQILAGKKPEIAQLPLAPIGSDFRREVWDILCEIPYGKVITYGDVAQKIAVNRNAKNTYNRAVGGAVGHNPISIIIPCHRVIGSSGNLTGYAGGIAIKIKLLELEGVDMSQMRVPNVTGASANLSD